MQKPAGDSAPGGYNQRSNPALPYAPEIVTDYEIGAKSDWFDRRLRVNLAVYHSNYKDIQRSVYVNNSQVLRHGGPERCVRED